MKRLIFCSLQLTYSLCDLFAQKDVAHFSYTEKKLEKLKKYNRFCCESGEQQQMQRSARCHIWQSPLGVTAAVFEIGNSNEHNRKKSESNLSWAPYSRSCAIKSIGRMSTGTGSNGMGGSGSNAATVAGIFGLSNNPTTTNNAISSATSNPTGSNSTTTNSGSNANTNNSAAPITAASPSTTSSSSSVQLLETQRHLSSLQRVLKLCRPKSVLPFIMRYLQDEKLSSTTTSSISTATGATSNQSTPPNATGCSVTSAEERHALHMLPFVISQRDEFVSLCCILFIAQQHSINNLVTAIPLAPSSTPANATNGGANNPNNGPVDGSNHSTNNQNESLENGESSSATTANNNTSEKDTGAPSVLPPPPTTSSKNPPALQQQPQPSQNGQQITSTTASTVVGITPASYYREYLDPSHIFEVLQAMDLTSYGIIQLQPSHAHINTNTAWMIIEDYISEMIEPLKQIDFTLFVASLRLILSLLQMVIFMKDEYYDFLYQTIANPTTMPGHIYHNSPGEGGSLFEKQLPSLPLPDDMKIEEVARWKSHLVK
jgi:hypothetical protein